MELSKEEKKAIEIIKGLYIEEYDWYEDSKYCTGHSGKAVAIVEDSLEKILKLIDNQQKEIEEKTTILLAGAEKVKQLEKEIERLEKGNRSLMESRIKWKNRYYKEKAKNKEKKAISQAIIRDTFSADYISKDKIREKIKEITSYAYTSIEERDCQDYARQVLRELLEENQDDGDHIPRID